MEVKMTIKDEFIRNKRYLVNTTDVSLLHVLKGQTLLSFQLNECISMMLTNGYNDVSRKRCLRLKAKFLRSHFLMAVHMYGYDKTLEFISSREQWNSFEKMSRDDSAVKIIYLLSEMGIALALAHDDILNNRVTSQLGLKKLFELNFYMNTIEEDSL
jgi:hypothetical protein